MAAAVPAPPDDLPVPVDDGACDHLLHSSLPASVSLPSTSGSDIDISTLGSDTLRPTILFFYPAIGAAGSVPRAEWNAIPGARGCTPQSCSFRDLLKELCEAGAGDIYGISSQTLEFSVEAKERLHLPYHLLSDEKLQLAKGMNLPTFEFEGDTRIKRLSLAVQGGKIVKVWYPVFPSSANAQLVLDWLKGR
jgi:peroxiredoxin